MNKNILVVGSSNTDMVVQSNHLPVPGETVLGGKFLMNPGGKGANQAVAAARLGGEVTFICKTGNDVFGKEAIELFGREGINTSYACVDEEAPSGVALITVDRHAENCIVVASGANGTLSPADVQPAEKAIKEAGVVLLQLEIPIDTVVHTAATASTGSALVILNPAPVCPLPEDLWQHINIITPNEKEAEMLSGVAVTDIETAKEAATCIHEKGVDTVIVTLGSKGALLLHEGQFTLVPTVPVTPVDTTAAGDVFNGAFATAIATGKDVIEAAHFACRAAAISVTRLGAQSSAPHRHEVEEKESLQPVS